MRPLLEDRTPKQLLWTIAVSNALTSLGFATCVLSPPLHHVAFFEKHYSLMWICLPAILIGLIATLFAEQALKDGIVSEQWPEALLVTPRKLFENPAISVLGWLLIASSFLVIAFAHGSSVAACWVFLAPAMSLQRIRGALRPRSDPPAESHPLYSLKPLQSEQWGTPSRPFSS